MAWKRQYEEEERIHAALHRGGWPLDAPLPEVHADEEQGLWAMLGRENIALPSATPDNRWHISLQHTERVPTWDELAATAHELRPGVPMCIGVPPRNQWMNVHERVLHLWEIHDHNMTELWKAEAQGHTPTKGDRGQIR